MSKQYQSIRGMNDLLPADCAVWEHVEACLMRVLHSYGYQQIRTPLLESTDVFSRSIGRVTDIIEKEMYTFLDRNGDSLSLRPEGTACCVRAAIQHGLLHNQTQRLWYMGPMFRHERPQQGRYRQFHQIGVECFGFAGPDIDAELIIMTARFWRQLGLNNVQLQLNSLGSLAARQQYRDVLIEYFTQHHDVLDEDSRRRLHSNPLRILDSKNPALAALNNDAPKLLDYLDADSQHHFEHLQRLLSDAGVAFTLNPRLVRGLDYYNRTVFEWVSADLGSQAAICAGGRYDGLVEQLGGRPSQACGFALGLERVVSLYQQCSHPQPSGVDVYIVHDGDAVVSYALQVAEQLRDATDASILCHAGDGSLKSQFKRAVKLQAKVALIIGADEAQSQRCSVKLLQQETPQVTLAVDEVIEYLNTHLN
jgi:histidyl-tRNA synthetase